MCQGCEYHAEFCRAMDVYIDAYLAEELLVPISAEDRALLEGC